MRAVILDIDTYMIALFVHTMNTIGDYKERWYAHMQSVVTTAGLGKSLNRRRQNEK